MNTFSQVSELKGQVESMQSVSRMSDADMEAQFMGSASSRRTMTTMDERHRDQLRKVEKERKDAQEVWFRKKWKQNSVILLIPFFTTSPKFQTEPALRVLDKYLSFIFQRMANEFKALEADFESTKNKLDASRARWVL